ncbi:MAG TPA: Rieske 2Fe-2S domain-containing protein [Verrucomicrobiae bacterium]
MLPCQTKPCLPNRRDFIAGLFTGLASCRLGSKTWAQPVLALMSSATDGKLTVKPSDFPVLGAVGGFIGLAYDTNYPVLISRMTEGYRVMRAQCPHAGGTVVPNGTNFRCTNHGSLFNHEGIAYMGPAIGGSLPQYESLHQASDGLLEISLPDMAYRVTVVTASGADRLELTFTSTPGIKYEIRFRAQLTGAENVVPFSINPSGTIVTTEVTASGTSQIVYVSRNGQSGFFLVNVKVTQL